MNMEPTIDTITMALDFNDQLDDAGIMYSCERWLDGYKWTFSDSAYEDGDIIILNFGTFGMFESYCMPWDDDDITRDTAEGMVNRLLGDWGDK